MTRRNTRSVLRRHEERLAAVEHDMAAGRYHTALESIRWVLGDKTIPPDMRLSVTLHEVRALLGIGKSQQASMRMCAAIRTMHQHNLWDLKDRVEEMIARVEVARAPDIGGVGY